MTGMLERSSSTALEIDELLRAHRSRLSEDAGPLPDEIAGAATRRSDGVLVRLIGLWPAAAAFVLPHATGVGVVEDLITGS